MNLNKLRPSRLVGLVEDTVAIAGSRVAQGAKSFAHGVRIEYKARQLAAGISDVQAHARKVAGMNQRQRDELMRDQVAIADRACELASKR
jgi:hypothetical protein